MRNIRTTFHSSRGFTLFELGIASALLGTLLTAVFLFMRAANSYLFTATAHDTAVRQVALANLKIRSDLVNTSLSTVRYQDSPEPFLIFLSSEQPLNDGVWSYDDSGALEWQKWVCYFAHPSEPQLMRAELPLDAPSITPESESPPTLDDFKAAVPPQVRVAGPGISEFQVFPGGAPDSVLVVLSSRSPTRAGNFTEIEQRCQIRMRN